MQPEPAPTGAAPARHTWVMTRHTLVLLVRDPGTPLAYTVMALVLLTVLHPVYDRLATPGTPGIVQAAPGIAVMFTLLALDVAGQLLLSERTWHTWDRLRSGPAAPSAILAGKSLPLIALFLTQQSMLFLFATAAFGFPLTAGTWRLPLLALLWALCVTSCGLALGVHARSQGQLAAASDIGALTITCLSGCLVPLTVLPHWVSTVAPATPGYWALHGFQAAVTGNTQAYAHSAAVITTITTAALLVSARGIRR
ncbi:ABC transporter permease [Streptomyces sp. MBT65]|uniref:ABC transporter permease n=1 Tax=Streptomyces sp. MBT65 TaxID=1488395 RepID=UPI00190D377B|nr:ABC transporter permease [Streptomyces sp. MBT65]MBK3577674.1 ABC transporter permease [Streptomyces sp. MBT65]